LFDLRDFTFLDAARELGDVAVEEQLFRFLGGVGFNVVVGYFSD
jgi:hypothetical protein